PGAAELWQSIDRLGQKIGLGVGLLVPALIILSRSKAESAAKINDLRPGMQDGAGQFHGNARWCGQKYSSQTQVANGFWRVAQAANLGWAQETGRRFGFAMF